MALDTQSFPLERYWLVAALQYLPAEPALFSKAQVITARKVFLAGANQLAAIKNWLSNADVIDVVRGRAELTDTGRLMKAQDERAARAWTWWLVHLHLCANEGSLPYSTFFCGTEPNGSWMTPKQAESVVRERLADSDDQLAERTLETYFGGVERAFRPGMPLYDLQLVDRRLVEEDSGALKMRRVSVEPAPGVVAYATFLFHDKYFSHRNTLDVKELLSKGLGRALGLSDRSFREALDAVHHDREFNDWIKYTHAVNLDSVQFERSGDYALRAIRKTMYGPGKVPWA